MTFPLLVTGGAGYIGSHTCKLLKNLGFFPIVYDNLSTGHVEAVQWGPFIEGDIQDKKLLSSVFDTYHPKAVIHFAADALVKESMMNPAKYYSNNVSGTLQLLEVMQEYSVNFIIFSSSCATYGNPKTLPITEEHPQSPINPYGRSKLMIEEILKDFDRAYGLASVSLRYFNAAGADIQGMIGENHENETHLIPLLLQSILEGNTAFSVFGNDYDTQDGTAIRDYIHVLDLADAHIRALQWLLHHKKSTAMNLGTGRGYSVSEIIHVAQKVCNRKVYYQFSKRREGDPPVLVADNSKAKELLGWNPSFSSAETIIKTAWKWHQKQYARCL